MISHRSWSGIFPLKPTIVDFAPPPFAITVKIWPSVDPCVHVASVRSGGLESFGASGPLPFAFAPWQNAQYFLNAAAPAVIGAGLTATGFLTAGAAALPPGCCANAADAHGSCTRNAR